MRGDGDGGGRLVSLSEYTTTCCWSVPKPPCFAHFCLSLSLSLFLSSSPAVSPLAPSLILHAAAGGHFRRASQDDPMQPRLSQNADQRNARRGHGSPTHRHEPTKLLRMNTTRAFHRGKLALPLDRCHPPNVCRFSAVGPTKVIPLSLQALAKSVLSERNPYPGWIASTLLATAIATMPLVVGRTGNDNRRDRGGGGQSMHQGTRETSKKTRERRPKPAREHDIYIPTYSLTSLTLQEDEA